MPGHPSFHLEPVPPFRLDLTVWVLRRRPDNLVDRWDGHTYRRVLVTGDDEPFEIAVSQSGPPEAPHLDISVASVTPSFGSRERATAALERLLGPRVDLDEFHSLAARDDDLGPLANQFYGFKPPRFQTLFEALVNGIACQQLTLTVGIRLLNRLAEAYGPVLTVEDGTFHAFPRPQDLANQDVEQLRAIGFSYHKAQYITGLARLITSKQFDPASIESLDNEKAADHLRRLKGVGRWTAEYVLLRGLGRIEVFPGDDVGARNNLQRWLGLSGAMNYDQVHNALQRWEGYGGLVYFHLLLKSLVEKGILVHAGGSRAEGQAGL